MPKRTEFASVSLDVGLGTEPKTARVVEEKVFRILLLGDFGGRGRQTKPVPIDRDNIDDVLAGLGVELALGGRIALRLRAMEDFHPDRIYRQVQAFQLLQAAEPEPKPKSPPRAPEPIVPAGGSLLDSIVDSMEPEPPAPQASEDELKAFVRKVVAPSLVPREDASVAERKARADAAAGELMRAILHHEAFQALEAAWRAVQFLVWRLETGEQLKLYLLDMPEAELSGAKLDDALRAMSWNLVAGNYTFGQTGADVARLARLAARMRGAGAAFVAEGVPGPAQGSAEWNAFRRLPEARVVGLALPRFLLRLPYGRESEPIESFRFEEMPGAPAHQEYLWGNPAFALANLLGQEFRASEIDGLPLHVHKEGGETRVKSCAEVQMTEEEMEWALDQGYIPLVWLKDQGTVCVPRFQSIADPATSLAGRWD